MIDVKEIVLNYEKFIHVCCGELLNTLIVYNFEILVEAMKNLENPYGWIPGSNIDLSISIDDLILKSINKDNEKDFRVFRSSNHHLLAKSCVKFLKKQSYDISLGDNDTIQIIMEKEEASNIVRAIKDMILESEVDRNVFGNLDN
jgi:hypothetical protein